MSIRIANTPLKDLARGRCATCAGYWHDFLNCATERCCFVIDDTKEGHRCAFWTAALGTAEQVRTPARAIASEAPDLWNLPSPETPRKRAGFGPPS